MHAWVDLYWLPLGAGGWFVRWNGRVYERWAAWREHRAPVSPYHSGLLVSTDGVTYAVEMGPVWNVRCWPGGHLPDVAEAIASPVRTTDDPARVTALLKVLEDVPPDLSMHRAVVARRELDSRREHRSRHRLLRG